MVIQPNCYANNSTFPTQQRNINRGSKKYDILLKISGNLKKMKIFSNYLLRLYALGY